MLLTPHLFAINTESVCVYLPVCAFVFTHMCLCVLGQDMGQDVESHFQEVLAALEQRAEEGGRGEGGALRSRLQQLYSKIVTDTDSGRSSLKILQSHARQSFSEAQLLCLRYKSTYWHS